jgi:hypothetical protein
MNVVKLERRISELEAQQERAYDSYLSSLTDVQLKAIIDGIRSVLRGGPVSEDVEAICRTAPPAPPFPESRYRGMTDGQIGERIEQLEAELGIGS